MFEPDMQLTDADVEAVKQEIVNEMIEKLEQVSRVPRVLVAELHCRAGWQSYLTCHRLITAGWCAGAQHQVLASNPASSSELLLLCGLLCECAAD